jgi:hypothetical protein
VCHEADVALYYKQHAIDLSDGLFLSRYSSSESAIQFLEGIQTSDEAFTFRTSLLTAPINSSVNIHNETTITPRADGYEVTPLGNFADHYYMTHHGRAQQLHGTVYLQVGDRLYLGRRTFTLPYAADRAVSNGSPL